MSHRTNTFDCPIASSLPARANSQPMRGDDDMTTPQVKMIYAVIVNDTVPNALCPIGVVRIGKQELIATFSDLGDVAPGCRSYLVKSSDLGRTWAQPYYVFEPKAKNAGVYTTLASLPNGNLLLLENVYTHLSGDLSGAAVFKQRISEHYLKISKDGGETFELVGMLGQTAGVGGMQGVVNELANGDLILPGYFYPSCDNDESIAEMKGRYGSGFFRSVDGGKTWGGLEVVFQEPPVGRDHPVYFNEAAYVIRADGSLVACARIDSEKPDGDGVWQTRGNNLWFTESSDHGKTWSRPLEGSIGGLSPVMARLGEDKYLLVCGDRHSIPTRKVGFYTSRNGRDFVLAKPAPYLRTGGTCVDPATGGAQCIVPLDEQRVYVMYYAADPSIKTHHNTYIEACLLQLD